MMGKQQQHMQASKALLFLFGVVVSWLLDMNPPVFPAAKDGVEGLVSTSRVVAFPSLLFPSMMNSLHQDVTL